MKRPALLSLTLLAAIAAGAAATELGTEKTQFTVGGKPTFLLGISYYGGLGAPNEICLRDLDEMQQYGFNWIRIWATWAGFGSDVSAVDREGNSREAYVAKLQWLLKECDRRGMIVDVTLSRGNGVTGPGRLQGAEAMKRAVQSLVITLKPYRNWYLDLANERNIKDQRFVSFEELVELRKLVKQLDSRRLVTASYAGDMSKDELRRYLLDIQVDFIAPHRPRNAGSPAKTAGQTETYFEWMKESGRIVPVHYQEPFRRGFSADWEPKAEDFLADLEGAREAKATGWCFHNGDQRKAPDGRPRRSFDVRELRMFDQLDEEEVKFLRALKARTEK